MHDPNKLNPTGRFTGLAGLYARCRPDYPPAAVQYILSHCRLTPGRVLVDVGSGTGISARLLAAHGLRVLGIEPNADMRLQAEAEPWEGPAPAPTYCDGRAEATGLPDAQADAVLSAQAFHWFAAEPALREFHRILRPGGWVALMWNERDGSDPCTASYGAVIRTFQDAAAVEGRRPGRCG
jgi:ubiquinone/menaquinone biosynthesis C-methylase UbiE